MDVSLPNVTTSESVLPLESLRYTRQQVELWVQHKSERRRFLTRQLLNVFEYVIAFFTSIVIGLILCCLNEIYVNYKQIISYICLVWTALYISRIIRMLIFLKHITDQVKRRHVISTIIKYFLLVATHIQISIYCFIDFANIYTIVIPQFAALFMPFFVFNKASNNCFSLIRTIKFVFSIIRFLVVMMLLLINVEKMNISQQFQLLPFWLLLFGSLLSFLFSITLNLISCCSAIKDRSFKPDRNQIIQ